MLLPIDLIEQALGQYLSLFRDSFSQPQWQHLVTVLLALMQRERHAKAVILERKDKDYSFCDAISFSVMKRLGLYLAFAYDSHFRQHGFSTQLDRRDWP